MQLVVSYLSVILVAIVSSALPVKLAASKLEAANSGWLHSIVSVIFSVIIINAAAYLIPIVYVNFFLSILVVGFVYESILDTTFRNGIYIAFYAVLIQFVVISIMLRVIFT